MFNDLHIDARQLSFPLTLLIGLAFALPASAQISVALDSAGSTSINLGAAGPNTSINFYIGQNTGGNDNLGAIFAMVTLSGGEVVNPAGTIGDPGAGTPGYFGNGNLFESTIAKGASNSQFVINQFYFASQPIMNAPGRELWFTLNLDTTGLDGTYTISFEDPAGSFRADDGAFIAVNNNLSFTVSGVLLGDVDLNGVINFIDIAPFIAVLSGNGFQAEADCDESGVVDFLDIAFFIVILSSQ